MPSTSGETVLCHYRYDPLDRLVHSAPSAESGIQRFYCKSRLATEIQGAVQRSIFQHDDQLLAQLRRENAKVDTTLLATDQQRSVLNVLDANRLHPLAYTPYGHRPPGNGLLSLLGFNGERPDRVTEHYLLGIGYRGFNPVLMRFNSPDSWSPFGEGGVNAYGYCAGDPRNRVDPSGHVWRIGKYFRRLFNRVPKAHKTTIQTPTVIATQPSSHSLNSSLIQAQDNTIKNLQITTPKDGRPEELLTLPGELESLRQKRIRIDPSYIPASSTNPQLTESQIIAKTIENSEMRRPLKKQYFNVARKFHNQNKIKDFSPPRATKIKFSDITDVQEFIREG
ncbi:RHS repeat-associated core domain-containing protein [Pseudomonas beijingensis]|jgi:RHS repeat-associated protein|uniref:RHS repeat-associated core domain-containing protein n=1 Tax=Pseudomonas beijingensis TaxID=2954101 RepID=A0ABY9FBS1_9PSED|nr:MULTISPECIES: RHS repeat-associated core domain-containing protein [unclassified Pseudomonas]WLH00802.1 RHS repeat-associated core domain-containing protein [Pseudomonas sp. FP2034]WLH45847.1 RHS repeat-associated core domain-containing protein [Pseudomonas sp. FP2262]WLI44934.1 RHS repeat-associated core domain-containing protein [Pseudomonas sp. FP830]